MVEQELRVVGGGQMHDLGGPSVTGVQETKTELDSNVR